MLTIRHYRDDDAKATWALFFYTVRNINCRDYSDEQVRAWAPDDFDFKIWQKRMKTLKPFIAEYDGTIVGYSDLQENGFIDHFFCHHEYQGKGVGRALMQHIFAQGEIQGIARFHSEVSITARPFYEHFGFIVKHSQVIEVRGQTLTNYVMEKVTDPSSEH
ncbi:GNAT family N-acetyltransferase [Vibrio cortegadensis]|uniref:GNAT family N-acetyltransferase n=1 Tax=Vibrio cortegadensis TaxID=1328770 RepID=UPI0021C35C2C|nr:GNAT family N-acetyltransferase [Vibrio cortegadensis]MDN3697191.1 GNAT family N-acetyltransferase [Vibrio cortegadensis]